MSLFKALTIAGSDSGGGAGIQADLKTFQELDVYGMSVITAITAQNTLGVHAVYPQTVESVVAQLKAVAEDLKPEAVKTGMLFSKEIIQAVAEQIENYQLKNLVIDPVMIAKGGGQLLKDDAIDALCEYLLPKATLITPNLPEAMRIADMKKVETITDMKKAAKRIYHLGVKHVLIKGGHLSSDQKAIDLLYDGSTYYSVSSDRIDTKHTHGTGCTYSAAITAELAKGNELYKAVNKAKHFITCAIRHSLAIGNGIGPTNHRGHRIENKEG
ncbi:bifunctional hydroxymethylpyrimidine kinase/phosphomethylpyrimidine kinase [Pueribacillus theae]|uniref:Hydroxymethylpyrimidine/phosphomethylpyrimidine kinase n=1 Tax=Pueribacillus theae TaxID=2171751 RepID=A0A2U1K890_9BACI|nr:bifunctional hydroxymethylpyrimidine kinase/phosphomethylpyrimidine kinase [Pueribacillus theae]PWA13333.1 bifunctional hydroxymethylpyrimidine kinase/phosphomethylpyrimidine kinase [Pueribacillus theae]